jgi:protein-L-isoaspartate(D-aspartate) O-methyltransferase
MLWRTLKVAYPVLAGFVTVSGVACAMAEGKGAKESPQAADPFESRRLQMVASQIEARGVSDACVLDAMRRVPRHAFVPPDMREQAYTDRPLPIGHHQTISQPYIVALMTELVRPRADTKVLEIGTGSGYQAAVLAECAGAVYTIEILPELGRQATELLVQLGYENVHTRIGDGFDGWEEHAPFDAIIVTAAPPRIPQPLLDQLAPGGRLVIPVGEGFQDLVLVTRTDSGFDRRTVTPVRFVPMTGKAQQNP